MKKWIGLILSLNMVAGVSQAQPIFLDFSAAGSQNPGSQGLPPLLGGDLDTLTTVFDQLGLFANTSTTQYDTNNDGILGIGDKFSDVGHAVVTDLLPPLGDDEGLGFLSEMTIAWTNLTGVTTSDLTPLGNDLVQTIAYDTTNTTFSFYFHGDADGPDGSPNADFGAHVGALDDTGMDDGEKILEIQIVGGHGTNTFDNDSNFISGSSLLMGEITFAKDNFWYFDNGDNIADTGTDFDFNELIGQVVPITLRSAIDQNTDEVLVDTSVAGNPGPAGFGDALFAVHSTHDGSAGFTLPEPSTLPLIMLGMLIWATRVYRKKMKS